MFQLLLGEEKGSRLIIIRIFLVSAYQYKTQQSDLAVRTVAASVRLQLRLEIIPA